MSDFAAAVKWDLLPYSNGDGLDVGCGDARPHDWFVGIDIRAGTGQKGPNQIRDARTLDKYFAAESQDFIFSSFLLQELDDWPAVLKGWWKILKQNGYLIVFLPTQAEAVAAEGKPAARACDPKLMIDTMAALKPWQLVEARTNGEQFFHVYRKCDGPAVVQPDPEKTVALMKLGAHGDALWASSVLPHLKEQGYHTIMYTQETGEEVLRHDPHIDRLIKFESRVPLGELGDLFAWMERRYKHCKILVECVEGTLLPSPQKIQYWFPMKLRHKLMDHNYVELHHMKCEVPLGPRVKFYPNEEEKRWANKQRSEMKGRVVVLVPNGSSLTKYWPYAGEFAKRLLERKDVTVVMLGDERGTDFKAIEEHRRFVKVGMGWSIRQAMTFCQLADVVVGQETGLLNCVSHEPEVFKVALLSHSSVENLTRDWPNAASLRATPACAPCHRLHYDWQGCNQDQATKAALCQAMISVDDVLAVTNAALDKAQTNSSPAVQEIAA